MDVGLVDQRLRPVDQYLGDPPASCFMQIIRMAQKGTTCHVAYDSQVYALGSGPGEKIYRTRLSDRVVHARTIDVTLHFRPSVLLAGLAQVVAHAQLGRRKVGRDQAALEGYPVEKRVVADDGVVEIDADAHGAGWPRPRSGRGETCEPCRDGLGNVLGGQPELAASVFLGSDLVHEDIVGSEADHVAPQPILRRKPFGDAAAQSPKAAVLLHDRDQAISFE